MSSPEKQAYDRARYLANREAVLERERKRREEKRAALPPKKPKLTQEEKLQRKREYYYRNREKTIAMVLAKYREDPDKVRDRRLIKIYGLTPAAYEDMLVAQGGACAICGGLSKGKKRTRLHVDHDHKTGKVRALLCSGCNMKVGAFEDPLHDKIEAYLKKHKESK